MPIFPLPYMDLKPLPDPPEASLVSSSRSVHRPAHGDYYWVMLNIYQYKLVFTGLTQVYTSWYRLIPVGTV